MMKYLIAGFCVLAAAGCELGPNAPDYGEATHNNIAAQSVQPTPPASAQPVPGNGAVAAIAQQRYSTDTVKRPASMTTSNVSVGSGGGGGGGQ